MMEILKKIKDERGVVMLETILVLPVYLLLLGGLFWLGELCLARLALTHGESLRLWENGTRYSITFVPEGNIFSFLPATGSSTDDAITGRSGFSFTRTNGANTAWGQVVSGRATLNTRRSIWSWGTEAAFHKIFQGTDIASPADRRMIARGTVDVPLESHLLSRRGYTSREGIYRQGTGNGARWQTEYTSSWNLGGRFDITPTAPGSYFNFVRYGNRNARYVTWSN